MEGVTLEQFEFRKFNIDEKKINNFTYESEFMEICVELFKEITNICFFLANTYTYNGHKTIVKFSRNEAIIRGNLTRLTKLLTGFLIEVCENRREISDIIGRCIFESIINLNYYVKHKCDNSIFDEYVISSLSTEIKLYNEINENIAKRGVSIPIEERMLKSIENSVNVSGFTIDELKKTNKKHKIIFEKVKEIYGDRAYLYLMSLPSHSIHGNWQEILLNNLKLENDEFTLNNDWNVPRPQNLNVIGLLLIDFLLDYLNLEYKSFSESEYIKELLLHYRIINKKINDLHENFLNKTNKDI